jgi:hypothetical protein
LVAIPFGGLGFIEYHGMKFEQFVWAWTKYQLLIPKKLTFMPTNLYYESLKRTLKKREKEGLKHHD